MNTHLKAGLVMAVCSLVLRAPLYADQEIMIGYQGVIEAEGDLVNNQFGFFKFVICNEDCNPVYWSNDGSSDSGEEPENAVPIPIVDGVFSVRLGDTSIDNMDAITPDVFRGDEARYLRVWFDDGDNGSEQLFPDQRVSMVPYAVFASSPQISGGLDVDGNVTIAADAGTAFLIEDTSRKLFSVDENGTAFSRDISLKALTTSSDLNRFSAGRIYYDGTTNQFKACDNFSCSVIATGTSTGDITSVTAGTGISGGGTSGDVTLSVNTSVVVTKTGDHSMVGSLSAAGFSTSGTISGGTLNITGDTSTGGSMTADTYLAGASSGGQQGSLVLYDSDSSNPESITINPPGIADSGSYTLTLPTDDGSADQVLTTNGSGVLSWSSAGGGDITGVTAGTGLSGGGSSGTVTISVASGGIGTTQIADNDLTTTDLNATLTFADSDLIDLSSINASSTTEGLKLPQATDVSAATAEGLISWDTDGDTLYIGTGTGVATISNPFGAAIDTGEITDGTITTGDIALDTIAAADVAANAIEASELANDAVDEASLKAVDPAGDEECLTYETTTGDFEWQPCETTTPGDITAVGDCGSGACLTAADTTPGILYFEGTTSDGIEIILQAADATSADKTITLPNTTGTIITTGDSNTVTGTMTDESSLILTNLIDDDDLQAASVDGGSGGEIADNTITADDINADAVGTSELDESAAFAWTGQQSWTTTVTATGQIQDVNITLGNDADADTVTAVNIDVTNAATGDADTLYGLYLNAVNAVDANVLEYAIGISANWEQAINANGTLISTAELQALDGGIDLSGSEATGTLAAARFPALTGDVTTTAGALATTIGADKVLESHLKAVDPAGDEECLTYETTTGDFEWQPCETTTPGDVTAVGDCGSGACLTAADTTPGILYFEGSTSDGIEIILQAADATSADKTITLPNTTGTIITTGDSNTVTGTMTDESSLILTNLIDDDDLQAASVDGGSGGEIADNTVSTEDILLDTILAVDIAPDAVGASEIGADQVGTSELDESAAFAWTGQQSWTTTLTNSGAIQDINLTLGNDADVDTIDGINIDVTSAATGDVDTIVALNIAGVASADATVNEVAIGIGANWDVAINANGTSISMTELQALDGGIETGDIAVDTILAADIATDAVDAAEIKADAVGEAELKVVDTAVDEECLTYEATIGDFEWQSCSSSTGDVTDVGDCTTGACLTAADTTPGILYFEGSTNDGIEIILQAADATSADKTITLPNTTGTVITTGDSNTVTGTMTDESSLVLTGLIDDDDLAAGAVDGGTGGEIADGSITAADLGTNSVDSDEIAADAVGASEIVESAVMAWTGSHSWTLAATEDLALTSDLAGSVNILSITATPSATAGTTVGLFINQANEGGTNTNGLDNGIRIESDDQDVAMTSGIIIVGDGAGAVVTTALDVSDNEITTALAIGTNTITTSAATIASTELDRLDGLNAALADLNDSPTWTGDHVFQLAATGKTKIDATATTNTGTAGVLDIDIASGNAAVDGINVGYTVNDGATTATDMTGIEILMTSNDADADVFGITITTADTANAGTSTYEGGILIDNADTTAASMHYGVQVTSSGVANGVSVAFDASAANINTALDVGPNAIAGTSASINFTEFTVSETTGSVTINDGGDAGQLSVEGTILDLNELTTASNTNLAITAGGTGDITINGDSDTTVSIAIADLTATEALCHATNDNVGTVVEEIIDCSGNPSQDYAELYPLAEGIEYGDVVALGTKEIVTQDGNRVVQLVHTTGPFQRTTVGVVSNNWDDFSSTGYVIDKEDNPKPIALIGRVPVKVTTHGGQDPIRVGDYLTSSEIPGVAMKATRSGPVIGKAITPLESGDGLVVVFVEHGYQVSEEDPQEEEIKLLKGKVESLETALARMQSELNALKAGK